MATDGGQIRNSSLIFGEQNHSQTCTTPDILSVSCVIVAGGNKSLARKLATRKGILVTDANGNAAFLEVPDGLAGQNKLLATDASGNLVWVDK